MSITAPAFIPMPSKAKQNGGEICLNGAAARLVAKGDIVIILTYHELEEEQCRDYHPRLVYVDEKNRITHTKGVMDEALDILRGN